MLSTRPFSLDDPCIYFEPGFHLNSALEAEAGAAKATVATLFNGFNSVSAGM